MTKHMDERIAKTKAAIRTVLFECLHEKSLENISVKELCARAGINRTTFYNHYAGVNELVEEIGQEQIAHLRALLDRKNIVGTELVNILLDSLEHAKELYRTKEGGISAKFQTDVVKTIKEYRLSDWKAMLPTVRAEDAETAYDVLLYGALHTAMIQDTTKSRERLMNAIIDTFHAYVVAHKK